MDGNVARVLARLFALDEAVDTPAGSKMLLKIATELIPASEPAIFNQAIMEFGALQCKPVNPQCETCPLSQECQAYKMQVVSDFPKKQKRSQVKELYFYYFVIIFQVEGIDQILLHRRDQGGIWKNMYDFSCANSDCIDDSRYGPVFVF